MKVAIDISEKDYECLKKTGQVTYGLVDSVLRGTPLPEKWRLIVDDELEKMIVVRKNATNGDVIKTMFPNLSGYEYSLMRFDEDWWNAQYKAGEADAGSN